MSSEQLATRILSEISKISEGIRTGNLSKNEFEKLIKSSENKRPISLY